MVFDTQRQKTKMKYEMKDMGELVSSKKKEQIPIVN